MINRKSFIVEEISAYHCGNISKDIDIGEKFTNNNNVRTTKLNIGLSSIFFEKSIGKINKKKFNIVYQLKKAT